MEEKGWSYANCEDGLEKEREREREGDIEMRWVGGRCFSGRFVLTSICKIVQVVKRRSLKWKRKEFGWMDGEREVIICQTEPGLMDSDLPCQSFFLLFVFSPLSLSDYLCFSLLS